jgi:hypothetical protein
MSVLRIEFLTGILSVLSFLDVSVDLRRFDDTKVGRCAGGHNPVFGVVGIPTG